MSAAPYSGRLFDVAPTLVDVEEQLTRLAGLRDQLASGIADCDRDIGRLTALAHALRELADDRATAAVAGRLAENGWSGSGDQLVTVARAVTAQERCS